MRRVASALLLLAAAGCGSSAPTAPGPPAPVSLQAGPHVLRIFTQAPVGQGGMAPSIFVCLTIGSRPSNDSVAVPVDVVRDGDRWNVSGAGAGTLRMRVEERAGSLQGTIEGQASEGRVIVTIGNTPQHPSTATVSGVAIAGSFAGEITGDVTFSEGAGSHSCSSNAWTLVRQ